MKAKLIVEDVLPGRFDKEVTDFISRPSVKVFDVKFTTSVSDGQTKLLALILYDDV